MKVGSIGDVVFSVEAKSASILSEFQRSISANYEEHKLIGQTATLEYTGTNPTEISFTIKLSAFYGINPKTQLEKIEEMARTGKQVTLSLGSSVIGEKWAIQSISSKAEFFDRDGDILSYDVSISLKESVTPRIKTDTSGYYLEAANTGWKKESGNWYYYLNGVKQTGWVYEGGSWYYLNESGVMQTGWLLYQGIWYYLRPYGNMATGWVYDSGGWYYLDEAGACQTGWIYWEEDWYYCLDNGKALINTSMVIGGKLYYFDSSGKCTNPYD